MKLKYKILIKMAILFVILIVLNIIYSRFFYEKDIQKHSDIINLVRNAVSQHSDVVYLGESSDFTSREDDEDKRSICSLIAGYYPELKFGDLSTSAVHAGIYYVLLKKIPEDASVKTVIVTLNLRSFDAGWINSDLETALQKRIVLLKDYPPLFNRFLLAFKGYDHKSVDERKSQYKISMIKDQLKFPEAFKYNNVYGWDNGMAKQGIKNPDGSINYPLTELACHYIKTYAFQIDTLTNPRIKDFDNIVLLAKKRNWNLVFNLLAENVEMADSLVGKELTYLIRQNRDLLVKRYQKGNVIVVDNLEKVHSAEYIDTKWTTEHYAQEGRRVVANNVAMGLQKIYPVNFKNVIYPQKVFKVKPSEFFNDCEGAATWGQKSSISEEKAFSGKKSSKVGGNQDYSLTFETPITGLPDSLKHIAVDFQLFQTDLNHDAKLVIEFSGSQIPYQWNGISLKTFSTTTQKWCHINYTGLLPANFYQGDLLKVYILNQKGSIMYLDDLKIKFIK